MTKWTSKRRHGFTIVELLVVVAIMAVIATLATGAAVKAARQNRSKRINMTAKALELALMNYRTLHGEWPFLKNDLVEDPRNGKPEANGTVRSWIHGKYNYQAFAKLCAKGQSSGIKTLDASSLMTKVNGSRYSLKKALEENKPNVSIGYPHPERPDNFFFFCIEFNETTDSITVHRQDTPHWNDSEDKYIRERWCPELTPGKEDEGN